MKNVIVRWSLICHLTCQADLWQSLTCYGSDTTEFEPSQSSLHLQFYGERKRFHSKTPEIL